VPPVFRRRDARELLVRVVHVEDFVAQNLVEDRARLRIVVDDLAIDSEASGCGLFRDVQKREQPLVRFVRHAEVIETMAAREHVAGRAATVPRAMRAEQRGAALAEEIGVMQFIDGVRQVEASQQRIGRHLRRPQDVVPAVAFDFRKCEQFTYAAIRVAPDPAMERAQRAIDVPTERKPHPTGR